MKKTGEGEQRDGEKADNRKERGKREKSERRGQPSQQSLAFLWEVLFTLPHSVNHNCNQTCICSKTEEMQFIIIILRPTPYPHLFFSSLSFPFSHCFLSTACSPMLPLFNRFVILVFPPTKLLDKKDKIMCSKLYHCQKALKTDKLSFCSSCIVLTICPQIVKVMVCFFSHT